MYWFSLDSERCDRKGIIVNKRSSESAPKMKYTTTSSNYMDGVFFSNYGTFETVDKSFDCNFVEENTNKWHEHWRAVKRWLLKDHDKLRYSDDIGVFRKVLATSISESEREVNETGNFSVTFTLEPYEYFDKGLIEHSPSDCGYNIYSQAHPIYIIRGGNNPVLTVNGNDFEIHSNKTVLFVDTELMLCYDTNKQLVLSTGDFEDLYLLEGSNTFEVSSGTLSIIPNWRSI